jgi:hypothetical protein
MTIPRHFKKGNRVRRVEIDVRGVFDSFYRIVDNNNDREMIINAVDWPKYKSYCSIVEEILRHRVIKTPVVRTFDPALLKSDPFDAEE